MGENNDINAKNSKKNWGWGIYQKIKAMKPLLPVYYCLEKMHFLKEDLL